MGQTLDKVCQWTESGKLEYNERNQKLLTTVLEFVKDYPARHSVESKVVFEEPLQWVTDMHTDQFEGHGPFRKTDQGLIGVMAEGEEPTFTLTKSGKKNKITVRSFEMLDYLLRISGSSQISETVKCLQANREIEKTILGDQFAAVGMQEEEMIKFTEEMLQGEDVEKNRSRLRILIQIRQLECSLVNVAMQVSLSSVALDAKMVEDEVTSVRIFCGDDAESHLLKALQFLEHYDYKYANSCRAPPWRQVNGEICYLTVVPFDTEPFSVTATTSGYFTNGGWDTEKNVLNFERDADYFPALVDLLKTKSGTFLENMQKIESEDTPDEGTKMVEKKQEGKVEEEEKGDESKKTLYQESMRWREIGLEQDYKDFIEREQTPEEGEAAVERYHTTDEFSESSSDSESEEEAPERRHDPHSDLPSEYWQIQKLVKYLKGGNQTATIIALCSMRDFNLAQDTCQLAIRDVGGLEVLINLLETEENKCKIGALQILKEISQNPQIRRTIADLGGLETMVDILRDPNKELKCLSAETIANVAKFRRARRAVRQHGGIKQLVTLLDCAPQNNTVMQRKDIQVARCGALALWSCSRSPRNREAMRRAGVIPLLARLLESPHEDMLVPVVGTLQECASEQKYRQAIRTEGMIVNLVNGTASENEELQMHCASAIFKCAEEKDTRDLVRMYGGLDHLVQLLKHNENKQLLTAATGAIWKCAISEENIQRFEQLDTITQLVNLLNDQPEQVLVNVVGALGEMAKSPVNRGAIRRAGGIPLLVNLLTGTNQTLLVNATRAIGQCAQEPENMVIIGERLDGVRLLWSLLKNSNKEVQANAAWAICPCIEKDKTRDAGEMVRSFVGGLELIVSLLKSDDQNVLAAVCAAIANIAHDEENLAVITDHGVVSMLARLTPTTNDHLREHLAEAIAMCCKWGKNREAFGKEGAVAPLVKYLKSTNESVHRSTARALFQLSKDAENCITMHNALVVKPLVQLVGSKDSELQMAAAGCLSNIRKLALANEKSKYKISK